MFCSKKYLYINKLFVSATHCKSSTHRTGGKEKKWISEISWSTTHDFSHEQLTPAVKEFFFFTGFVISFSLIFDKSFCTYRVKLFSHDMIFSTEGGEGNCRLLIPHAMSRSPSPYLEKCLEVQTIFASSPPTGNRLVDTQFAHNIFGFIPAHREQTRCSSGWSTQN